MKKFNKIIFHVGPDKTGSTSIQKTLKLNKKVLLEYGYLYALGNRHHLLASYFSERPEKFAYNINSGQKDKKKILERDKSYIQELWHQLENTHAKSVIFSYEGFVHLSKKEIEQLRDFFKDLTDNFLIVMYAREPISYALSAMSQRVKMGRPSWSSGLPIHLYRSFIERFVSVFGRGSIKVNIFERSQFINGNVVDDFLDTIGLPVEALELFSNENAQENKALTFEGMMVGDKIIAMMDGQIKAANQFRVFVPHLENIPGQAIYLTDEQRNLIYKNSIAETDYLREEFGVVFGKKTGSA
jgi:hypothetical protein